MTLHGRVALITGGKRIGAVIARRLADAGADVALVYNRSRDEAENTAGTIRALGRRAVTLQANLASRADCSRIVADTVAEFGRLDVLINMASLYESKPFAELTVDDWDTQLDVDLRSAFLCAHAAAPHMRATGGGRIVNFSDWVAASGRPRYFGYVPYYVAKHGVIALTEALALELAADQILVNAIAPGPIVAPPGTSAEEYAAVEKATPLGRWGGEDEIAKAVLFLIESDFVTGETIRVDGGRHIS
ncbi:MAG: SDR family oxidoreductase [Acidobacteria bacterium]|nr:SDR family oxidoreductase [Acidobacteriota bacterium]